MYIRFMNGDHYAVDHVAQIKNGRQIVLNVLNMDFSQAHMLFSDKNRTYRMTYNDGKNEEDFVGYTRIMSIAEDENNGVHIWMEKE